MLDVIYLDAAASTPMAPEALAATIGALTQPGNPGALHASGRENSHLVNVAREQVAALMSAGPSQVVFLGTATEANNLALRTMTNRSVVTTTADHPSVLATARALSNDGRASVAVGVLESGVVDMDGLRSATRMGPSLISIHGANNETGVVQPLWEIGELARESGALLHVDASQMMAWGANPLLDACDLVTVSSHKMHGPQGAAALIVRPSARAQLRAQMTGGGQEHGLRSGTPNVAAIAGFGAAAELALTSGASAASSVETLRLRLLDGLARNIGDVVEHGVDAELRLPGILNVSLGTRWSESVESEALLARLPGLAASTGSACHAGAPESSPVLRAMGVTDRDASRAIRFSLNRYTTRNEIDQAVLQVSRAYDELVELLSVPPRNERSAV